MKKLVAVAVVFILIISLQVGSLAENDIEKISKEYIIGARENTFKGLYTRMCKNLDIKSYPIPEPEIDGSKYGTNDYEKITILKDDDETLEYIGYVYDRHREPIYIIRSWVGYHKHGELIGMTVYYSLKGEYIGNIQRDYTNNLSNSSSRMPYYISNQGTHKLE